MNRQDSIQLARLICHEQGLTEPEESLIMAVIDAESSFNVCAKGKNTNGSVDWGICQFNDGPPRVPPHKKWWIGQGRTFQNAQECLDNPRKCIEVMIREYKKGRLWQWWAYKSGKYKKYLNKQ